MGMCVTPNEIADIVAEMSCNKSPGLDDLTSEHLKKANCQLSVLLSILLSALLVHGRVPSDILKTKISVFQTKRTIDLYV